MSAFQILWTLPLLSWILRTPRWALAGAAAACLPEAIPPERRRLIVDGRGLAVPIGFWELGWDSWELSWGPWALSWDHWELS